MHASPTPALQPRQPGPRRAWLAMNFGDDRSYAGNAGYDDEPGRSYAYDSFVPNHKRVAAGDVVLLRDQRGLLGVGRVGRIDARASVKERFRCPECGTANLTRRRRRAPTFRCEAGHEFERATLERAPCTAFRAHFTEYVGAAGAVELEALRAACPRYSNMNAIQEIALGRVARQIVRQAPDATRLVAPWLAATARLDAGSADDAAPAAADPGAEEAKVLRAIRARRGQQAFRDALVRRFGGRCVVTGCGVLDVLEAAHIRSYRGPADNAPANGLLLRADVHTLFDLDLLSVEPSSLVVRVHPSLLAGEYGALAGRALDLRGGPPPDAEALAERWARFMGEGAVEGTGAERTVPVAGPAGRRGAGP